MNALLFESAERGKKAHVPPSSFSFAKGDLWRQGVRWTPPVSTLRMCRARRPAQCGPGAPPRGSASRSPTATNPPRAATARVEPASAARPPGQCVATPAGRFDSPACGSGCAGLRYSGGVTDGPYSNPECNGECLNASRPWHRLDKPHTPGAGCVNSGWGHGVGYATDDECLAACTAPPDCPARVPAPPGPYNPLLQPSRPPLETAVQR